MHESRKTFFTFRSAKKILVVALLAFIVGDVTAEPLLVVSKLDPKLNPSTIETDLKNYFNGNPPQLSANADAIRVEPMSQRYYDFVSRHFGQMPSLRGGQAWIEPDGDQWVLYLAKQKEDLEFLKVTGKQGGEERDLVYEKQIQLDGNNEFKIGGIGDFNYPVFVRAPGVYKIRLPSGFQPERYEARVRELVPNANQKIIKADWPAAGSYCLITIPEFKGQINKLKEVCKNPAEMPHPINITDSVESVRIVHAYIGDIKPGPVQKYDGQTLSLKFTKPDNREPKRVWVKLPLTRDDATQEAARLEQLDPAAISAEIRASNPQVYGARDGGFPEWNLPNGKAQWYEMPEIQAGTKNEHYYATWDVVEPKYWQNKGDRGWYLKVYEFENLRDPSKVQALQLIHDGRDAHAIEEEVFTWKQFNGQAQPEGK